MEPQKYYTNCFSAMKFRSGQISVSTSVHEHGEFLYPSITFCPKFKEKLDLVEILENITREAEGAVKDIGDLDFDALLEVRKQAFFPVSRV